MADAHAFWDAFMAAIESQDSRLVLRVVEESSHLLNQRFGPKQDTPLVVAVQQNRWDFAFILLHSGADPNMAAGGGRLPLYEASYLADVQLTEMLLAYGGDPFIGNGYYTPLISAAAMGRKDVVDCLLSYDASLALHENDCGDTALSCSYRFGYAEVCRSLLLAGTGLAMSKRRAIANIDGDKFMTGRRKCDEVFEWFEDQLQLSYQLHRARVVYDEGLRRQVKPDATVPEYLSKRATQGRPMPMVHVAGQQEAVGGLSPEEEERRAVALHVVVGLNPDLFNELLAGLKFAGRDWEEEQQQVVAGGGDPLLRLGVNLGNLALGEPAVVYPILPPPF